MQHIFNASSQDPLLEEKIRTCAARLCEGDRRDLDLVVPGKGNLHILASDTPTDIGIKLYELNGIKPRYDAVGKGDDHIYAEKIDAEGISLYRATLDAIRVSRAYGENIVIFMYGDYQLSVGAHTQIEEIENRFPQKERAITPEKSSKKSPYANEGGMPSAEAFFISGPKTLQ